MSPPDRANVHVRLPRSLIERLRQLAADEGVSLNTLLVALIAEGSAKKRPRAVGAAGGTTKGDQSRGNTAG